jgi:hypothetical protein
MNTATTTVVAMLFTFAVLLCHIVVSAQYSGYGDCVDLTSGNTVCIYQEYPLGFIDPSGGGPISLDAKQFITCRTGSYVTTSCECHIYGASSWSYDVQSSDVCNYCNIDSVDGAYITYSWDCSNQMIGNCVIFDSFNGCQSGYDDDTPSTSGVGDDSPTDETDGDDSPTDDTDGDDSTTDDTDGDDSTTDDTDGDDSPSEESSSGSADDDDDPSPTNNVPSPTNEPTDRPIENDDPSPSPIESPSQSDNSTVSALKDEQSNSSRLNVIHWNVNYLSIGSLNTVIIAMVLFY